MKKSLLKIIIFALFFLLFKFVIKGDSETILKAFVAVYLVIDWAYDFFYQRTANPK